MRSCFWRSASWSCGLGGISPRRACRIRSNLFSIEDELLIDRKRTRIRRAISKKTMKGRMRGDLTAEFDHTVFDEWGLIAALLSEITLRA